MKCLLSEMKGHEGKEDWLIHLHECVLTLNRKGGKEGFPIDSSMEGGRLEVVGVKGG